MRFQVNNVVTGLFLTVVGRNNNNNALAVTTTSSTTNPTKRQRKLNYELLAGYEPRTLVTNQAAIDLDQAEMEYQLSHHHLDKFRHVYEKGGHSLSVARLTLLGGDVNNDNSNNEDLTTLPLPSPPTYEIPKNTEVIGWAKDGDIITGQLYEPLVPWNNDDTNVTILVEYKSNIEQSNYLECQVGGLVHTDSMNEDGCFAKSSSIQILDLQTRHAPAYHYNYVYNVKDDNYNERTMQSMSLNAKKVMHDDCNSNANANGRGKNYCPHEEYMKFVNYYNSFSYADDFVQAALNEGPTPVNNGIDFTNYKSHVRAEALRLTTKYMHVWMYTIGTLQQAISQCHVDCGRRCDDMPIREWDEAAAYYIGSLEKQTGEGKGYLLYDLADRTCPTFRTCSRNDAEGNADAIGTSSVNKEILLEFQIGQHYLFKRQCDKANAVKERIIRLMRVPLVQATLFMAYMRHSYLDDDNDDDAATDELKSATLAATILPIIHDCNQTDAMTILQNMQLKASSNGTVDFVAVKQAFENNYECMGITCEDVGGVWENGEYGHFASPCASRTTDSTSPENAGIVLTMFGVVAIVGLVVFTILMIDYYRRLNKYGRDDKFSERDDIDVPDNLATVDID